VSGTKKDPTERRGVKRSERRGLQRELERRILAGERKADIIGQAAATGQDWQTLARLVARIPTSASRRRWRWLNRALVTSIAASAAVWAASLFTFETGIWLAVALLGPMLLAASLWGVAHYRQGDYVAAAGVAAFGLHFWLFTIAWHSPGLASGALDAVEAALCGLVIILSLLATYLLLPATSLWGDRPKKDATGQLMFEE
jgi:hypothetical protein